MGIPWPEMMQCPVQRQARRINIRETGLRDYWGKAQHLLKSGERIRRRKRGEQRGEVQDRLRMLSVECRGSMMDALYQSRARAREDLLGMIRDGETQPRHIEIFLGDFRCTRRSNVTQR